MLMGNRPIAPNEIDDPENLMGFIDWGSNWVGAF
jgi:hypothetical protein